MRAFATILLDSIRLLRARVLFWITMGISIFAGLVYLSIGFDDAGLTLVFGAFHFDVPWLTKGSEEAELMYYGIFSKFIVGVWLTWIATILALISCAPIFPEFMEEGTAGIALSKPVSRPALFLYKFAGGLMFMAVQVTLFVVIVFLAIRLNLGVWNFSVFWSIPVVLLVFSYLFSVMVWLGVRTRSVMASVLLTLLFWLFSFLFLGGEAVTHHCAMTGVGITGEYLDEEGQENYRSINAMFRVPYAVLPKTGETAALLDQLVTMGDGKNLGVSTVEAMNQGEMSDEEEAMLKESLDRHSPGYVIGTSLLFEAVVLLLAMRTFCRRDF